jgi:hypothetical protein
MSCTSTAAANNLKVEVTGSLTYNKTAISKTPVYLGYSADAGNRWENFSLVQTGVDGGFAAVWTPNATGNYLLCAQWMGNDTLHWMNATVNLSLTSDSAGNEFSVMSNSTVSNFNYEEATRTVSFNTNGTKNTTGYMQVCIPKTVLSDWQTLTVNMDDKSVAFGGKSQDDVWVISSVYTQSEHAFTLQVPLAQLITPETTPWLTIIVVLAVIVAVVAVAVVVRRRRRTAATVAAILKETRPTS